VIRLLVAFALFLSATLAQAEVRLLTSIKPLQLIAAAVQDGVGEPQVLLPPGASPHHFALRPSDLRRLQQADLFYWVGPNLEAFLGKVLVQRERPSVALQQLPGLYLRHFPQTAQVHEDEHEHADDDDHEHAPGALDAHLWLAPANAKVIAARMAADLSAADPANAARYAANLAAFEARLTQLDAQLGPRLAGLANKPFFVFHDAYGYFEEHYGLQHAGVFSVLGEVQPGARHVAAMRAALQQAGPSCVFSEPPVLPRLAATLTEGLPARLEQLDALGMAIPANAQGYPALLEQLGGALANCLESL